MNADNQGAAPLKIYRLSISPSEFSGYRSCIVIAESEWHARHTHPSGCSWDEWDAHRKRKAEWMTPRYVKLVDVQEVGIANADQVPGVLCAHYVTVGR